MRSKTIKQKITVLRQYQLQFDHLFALLDAQSDDDVQLKSLYNALIKNLDDVEFINNELENLITLYGGEPLIIVKQCLGKLNEIESAGAELQKILIQTLQATNASELRKTKKYLDRLHEIAPKETQAFFDRYQRIEKEISNMPVEARAGIKVLRTQIESAIKEKVRALSEIHNALVSERKDLEKSVKEAGALGLDEIAALRVAIDKNEKGFNAVNEELCKIIKTYQPKQYDYAGLKKNISNSAEHHQVESEQSEARLNIVEEASREFIALQHGFLRKNIEIEEIHQLLDSLFAFLNNEMNHAAESDFTEMQSAFLREGVEKVTAWQEKQFFRDRLAELYQNTPDHSDVLVQANADIKQLLIDAIKRKQSEYLAIDLLPGALALMTEDLDAKNILQNTDALDEAALIALHHFLYRPELTKAYLHNKITVYLNNRIEDLKEAIISKTVLGKLKTVDDQTFNVIYSTFIHGKQSLTIIHALQEIISGEKPEVEAQFIIDYAKEYAQKNINDGFITTHLSDFFEENNKERFSKKLIEQLHDPKQFVSTVEMKLHVEKLNALKKKWIDQLDLTDHAVEQLWPNKSLPVYLLFKKTEKNVLESNVLFKARMKQEYQQIEAFFETAFLVLAKEVKEKNILARIESAYHIDFNENRFNQVLAERLSILKDNPLAIALLAYLENQSLEAPAAKQFISALVTREIIAKCEDEIIYSVMIQLLRQELKQLFLEDHSNNDVFVKAMMSDITKEQDTFKLEQIFLTLVNWRQRLNPVVVVDHKFGATFTRDEQDFFRKKLTETGEKFSVSAKSDPSAVKETDYHVTSQREVCFDEGEKAFSFQRKVKWVEKNAHDQSLHKEGNVSYDIQSELTAEGRKTKTTFSTTENIPWKVAAVCAARDLRRLRELEKEKLTQKYEGMKSRFGEHDSRVVALKQQSDAFYPKAITLNLQNHDDKSIDKMQDSSRADVNMPFIVKETIKAYFEAGFNHIEWEGKVFTVSIAANSNRLFSERQRTENSDLDAPMHRQN